MNIHLQNLKNITKLIHIFNKWWTVFLECTGSKITYAYLKYIKC